MKRKRFSVEQIVAIVKQAEMGMPVAELIRRVGGWPRSRAFRDLGEYGSRWETCPLDRLQLWHTPLVYSDRALLLVGIRAEAAGCPTHS
jgi:hypothetical protein